jgi:hypothetical protein
MKQISVVKTICGVAVMLLIMALAAVGIGASGGSVTSVKQHESLHHSNLATESMPTGAARLKWYARLNSVAAKTWKLPKAVGSGGLALLVRSNPAVPDSTPTVELYIRPATDTPQLSQAQAEAAALAIDNGSGLSVSQATYANVTDPADELTSGSLPSTAVVGRNVWMVQVTSPQPVSVQYGCKSGDGSCATASFANDTLLLDPATGTMLSGFFS